MVFFRYLLIFTSCLFFSCSGSYMGKERFGAEEFVLDSYKIREGKFAILEMEGKVSDDLDDEHLEEYADTIHEDDILQIAVYHPKRKDISMAVQSISGQVGYRVMNGFVHLPDLGSVCVKSLTLNEAAKLIQKRYREEIEDIEVFITYKERIFGKVELAGLVSVPFVPVDGKIRLFDVLAKARVPPDANLFKSYMVRDNKLLAVDFYKLLKEGDMEQNVVMRGGDKIYIADPFASTLLVMGEVGCESVISVPYGFMSLRRALAAAKGIPSTGDKSYIQVIRGSIVKPKIYILSWDHVVHLPNDSLLLIPGDIVYVASKPITEWNRFISQLLPSFSGMDAVVKGCGTMGIVP